ncbi:MAG: hypothetical protein ACRD0F_00355, partial [Acidimicrobiales bacterium]
VYDWSHYRGSQAVTGPADVDAIADAGVQTLYLQTAKPDVEAPGVLEPDLLLPIIDRARLRGMKVVAWYLPTLVDIDNDMARLMATAALRVDGLAVDIESRDVADPGERNRRLVELSRRLRSALPDRVIGGIVLPPVVTEVINTNYWPGFPWAELAPLFDVWMTMGYWTNRTVASGWRDAHLYTVENVNRMRANLGLPDAPVHPIGGIGDRTTTADLDGFRVAVEELGAIGGSIYDWRTTAAGAWSRLRALRA